MSNTKYNYCNPSQYHFKKLSRKAKKSEVRKYEISCQKDDCVVGLIDSNCVFKYVNLSKLSHSRYYLCVGNEEYSTRVKIPWNNFQILQKNQVIFTLSNCPYVYYTPIPAPHKTLKNSHEKVSRISRVYELCSHQKRILDLKICPNNHKLFVTINENGTINLFHLSFKSQKKSLSNIPLPTVSTLWKYEPKSSLPQTSLTVLYNLRDEKKINYYSAVCNSNGDLYTLNLRTKNVGARTIHGTSNCSVALLKEVRFSYGRKSKLVLCGKNDGNVFIYKSHNLLLENTIYIGVENGGNCTIHDVAAFTHYKNDHDILVASVTITEKTNSKNRFFHCVKFVDVNTKLLVREFVYDNAVLFCDVKMKMERAKEHVIIGNVNGILNAWSVTEIFEDPKEVKKVTDLEISCECEEIIETQKIKVNEVNVNVNENENENENVNVNVNEDEDEDEVPMPLTNVPVPSPKNSPDRVIIKPISIIKNEKKSKSLPLLNNDIEVADSIEIPRSVLPIPSSLHTSKSSKSTSKSIKQNEMEKKKKKGKGKKRQLVMRHKRIKKKTMKKGKKVKMEFGFPKPPKVAKKLKIGKKSVKIFERSNYGKPEEFMTVLHDETVRKTFSGQNLEAPINRFARRRVMNEEKVKGHIENIKKEKFNKKEVIKQVKRKTEKEVLKFKMPKIKYEKLTSLSVDENGIKRELRSKNMGKKRKHYSAQNYTSTNNNKKKKNNIFEVFGNIGMVSDMEDEFDEYVSFDSYSSINKKKMIRLKPRPYTSMLNMSTLSM